MVVVTSRSRLTALSAVTGAHPLTPDLLAMAEARELLVRRLGSQRAAAEPAAVADIIVRCGRLPLALALTAARADGRRSLPLATFAAELADARQRLDALDADDPATGVRAAFFCSYRRLSTATARLFRLLGLRPRPDFAAPAAASLAGVPIRQIRPALAELTRAHLLTEHLPGRYLLHDLLYAYAGELAAGEDDQATRDAAVHRTFDRWRLASSHPGHRAGQRRGDHLRHRRRGGQ